MKGAPTCYFTQTIFVANVHEMSVKNAFRSTYLHLHNHACRENNSTIKK